MDLDAKAFYPTNMIKNNIATDKLIGVFEDDEKYRDFLILPKYQFILNNTGKSMTTFWEEI